MIISKKRLPSIAARSKKLTSQWLTLSTAYLMTIRQRPYRTIPIAFLIITFFFVTGARGQTIVRQASPERVPVDSRAVSEKAPTPISLDLAKAFQEGRNIHSLSVLSKQEIAAADKAAAERYANTKPGPKRVGLVRSAGSAPLSVAGGFALRSTLPNGSSVWTMAIRSPGAFGLRVHFSDFDTGAGSVIVYAGDRNGLIVRGPFTGKGPNRNGDFWTASLPGDTAFIEISGTDEPRLAVAEIIHFDKHPGGESQSKDAAEPVLQPCHLDVMCYDSSYVHPNARDAVGHINLRAPNGNLVFICSGTILNDLDNETRVPYFLTAYHCGITPVNANSLEVVYLYQSSVCDGVPPNFMTLPRSVGGTVLESNPSDGGNDMTFIRLDGGVPGGVTLAGWSTGSLPSYVTGIHHPQGSWKRVTFQVETPPVFGLPLCRPTSQYHYLLQVSGITEPGSSGSGIFNNQGQLMGQLLGVCFSSGTTPDCSNRDEVLNEYGRFDVTYPIIRRWLEIGGTIYVDRNYTGTELGTPTQPFRTVTAAYNLAWDGARIKVKAGVYPETLSMSKQVTILGIGGTVTIGQ